MGGLWTEQKKLVCDRERLHSCRQMFRSDHIDVMGDRLALPVSLREVIGGGNRVCGCRREVIEHRAHVLGDRIKAMWCGLRACRRQR
jgi:hypothetical protein